MPVTLDLLDDPELSATALDALGRFTDPRAVRALHDLRPRPWTVLRRYTRRKALRRASYRLAIRDGAPAEPLTPLTLVLWSRGGWLAASDACVAIVAISVMGVSLSGALVVAAAVLGVRLRARWRSAVRDLREWVNGAVDVTAGPLPATTASLAYVARAARRAIVATLINLGLVAGAEALLGIGAIVLGLLLATSAAWTSVPGALWIVRWQNTNQKRVLRKWRPDDDFPRRHVLVDP